MTVKRVVTPNRWIGASSDTKPTQTTTPRVRDGDTFLEYDTRNLYITYDGTNWVLKEPISGLLKSVADEQTIDASLGAYTAGDVVGEDDCCTTLAIPWSFDIARASAGYAVIWSATLTNETENQAVQYDLLLFNTTPTGELRDNAANTNPVKGDYATYLDKISFPYSVAKGATVATYTQATSGDGVSGLPIIVKCTTSVTTIKGVLVTNTAYTQTPGDVIRIVLSVEQY